MTEKYRIKIEKITRGKYKHLHNIMIYYDKEKFIEQRLRNIFASSIAQFGIKRPGSLCIRVKVEKVFYCQYTHICSLSLYVDNPADIKQKIMTEFETEYEHWRVKFTEWLLSRKGIEVIDEDLIDYKSRGHDISKEEFLENEIFFEKM